MTEQYRTLSDDEITTLVSARVTLRAIAQRALYGTSGMPSSQADGMVYAKADAAENAVFGVLNFADSWWHLGLTSEQLYMQTPEEAA